MEAERTVGVESQGKKRLLGAFFWAQGFSLSIVYASISITMEEGAKRGCLLWPLAFG